MKNLRLLAALVILAVSMTVYSCGDDTDDGTSEPAGPSFSVTEVDMEPVGSINDVEINGKIKVKNTSDAQINLYWIRNNITVPTGWETALCDHELCYPTSVVERDLILDVDQEVELKLVFRPDGNRGPGSADIVLYDKADRAGSEKTYSFTATTN